MNPAPSIVFFTTASGAGYGLLFWLALLLVFGLAPASPALSLAPLGIALILITAGLVSSLGHLGRPERAWRALSQWRSSWLSREGVAAALTYPPALLLGLAVVIEHNLLIKVSALVAALGAVATVWCTGMIYASLKPIRQWHHPMVPWGYLLFAAFSGITLLAALLAFFEDARLLAMVAAVLGGGAIALKRAYWDSIDAPAAPSTPTLESSTGLGRIGRTRPLDPPHTEQNWLLREMGFRVARAHRKRLRRLVMIGFTGATALNLVALAFHGSTAALPLLPAALLALGAMLIERWLMFAEATHTVTLYYNSEG